ncbi:complex I subunit 1/NuoH family protein [Halocalculus aciditolerans]|uniref:NADH dehydrogenase n=1 Tax=Halocalculus aciditolerans TaxID=1383812 RepID=A0A830FKH9_9EURY|nr:complex I subunit 1 family protein [Halocalculus aciditolerans]GGL61283.1 NADH dehydrogenase [Halocalculus aciditolerans]
MTTTGILSQWLGYGANPPLWVEVALSFVVAVVVATIMMLMSALAGPWAKRKITAAFTDRIAVDRVGPWGLFIIIASAIQLSAKELIIPEGADRPAYDLAPFVLPFSAFMGFAVIPFGSGLQLADPETGVVYLFAVASIASVGLVMGGYSSGSKYSLLGSLRAVAQNIAYEIPLVVLAASVVLFAGSLQISEIVAAQQGALLALGPVTIPQWYAFVNPFAFVLFVIANLAEVGRNPFDLPEAATEIVGGYITEYSSVYFVLFFLGEFLHIFLGGAIIATLFLGGPAGPGPEWLGIVWFIVKIWGVFLFTQWCRSAVPRLRMDQVIEVGWKFLLVLAFANLVLTAVIVGVFQL